MLTLERMVYSMLRHSFLVSFVNGEVSPDELWQEIQPEVIACIAACAKGGTGHVIITDGPSTQVLHKHVANLLAALGECKLPLQAGAYIADALIMSDYFEWEDEAVAEALFFLSDESAPLTQAEVEEARSRLATAL